MPATLSTPLDAFWKQLEELPLVEEVWPRGESRSFREWLLAHDSAEAQGQRERMEFVRHFSIVPIVAVAGLINSGKSSLVCAFLTAKGRARVLRGVGSREGTQRFTLWLPESWREPAFLARLEENLARVFGHAPEPLASEPEQALAQQRAAEGLGVPLLAFDAQLDRQGIALLDCPDVQRVQPGEATGSNVRLETLEAAGEICAGVILVAPRVQIEVRELQHIAARLPKATRIYAINLLRRERAEEVLAEARGSLGLTDGPCFVAYDFEVESNREFAPAIDPNYSGDVRGEDRLPFFFEASLQPEKNTPSAVGPERSILNLGTRLDPEALRQKRQRELMGTLRTEYEDAFSQMEAQLAESGRELDRARDDLFERMLRLMHDGKNFRIKIDPAIAASLAESVRRTAPWDIGLALAFNQKIFGALRTAVQGGKRALDVLAGKFRIREQREKMEKSQLDPARVQEELAIWSAAQGAVKDKAAWLADAGAIVERFRIEERTNLLEKEWDEVTREFWKTAPRGRARLAIAGTLLATLGAAAWIAIEPLSGAVVFGTVVHGHVVALTVWELFAAFGVGAVAAAPVAAMLELNVESKLGRQQLANLFAIACDQLGLPREIPPAHRTEFPPPRIVEQPKRDSFGIKEQGWSRAHLLRKNLDTLRSLLVRL